MPEAAPQPRETLVVDDGSTDGTGDLLEHRAGSDPLATLTVAPAVRVFNVHVGS